MLDAVGWANRRIARFGLGRDVELLWEFGHAVLLLAGEVVDAEGQEWEYDSAEAFFPIARLVLRFEDRMRALLTGD